MIRGWPRLTLLAPDGRLGIAAHVFLYLLGAAHWMAFLNFGGIPFGLLDWSQEHFFYSVQREAFLSGVVPLHVSVQFFGTDRFLAIPLVVFAPHVLLLRWLPIAAFVLVRVLAFYSLGYLGTVVLASRNGLRWPGFLAFYLLFNFNGYLTSHLAVGHTALWAGYFFLPFFVLLIFEWVEKGPSVSTSLALALVVFLMSLVGSFHTCTWCMIFIGLLGLRKLSWLKFSVLTGIVSALLLAYRVLPGMVAFKGLRHGHPAGYPGLSVLLEAFVGLNFATRPTVNAMGWWEYDLYIGIMGSAFLLGFGLLPIFLRRTMPGDRADFRLLNLPISGMALLAYGEIYWWTLSDFPVLGAERVVTRLLIVPLVALAALAAIRLDALRKTMRPARAFTWLAGGAMVLMAVDLARHSWLWRIANLNIRIPHPAAPGLVPFIANRPDAIYVWALAAGVGMTFLTLVGVLVIMWRRWRTTGSGLDA